MVLIITLFCGSTSPEVTVMTGHTRGINWYRHGSIHDASDPMTPGFIPSYYGRIATAWK